MKKQLIGISVLSIVIATSTAAFGGGKKHQDKDHAMKHVMIETILDLSDEQKTAIKDIRHNFRTDMKAERKTNTAEPSVLSLNPTSSDYEVQLEAMAELKAEGVKTRVIKRGQMHAQVFAILTSEQQEKFLELQEKARNKSSERRQK